MEKRARPRRAQRLTCEILSRGGRSAGIVRDLSERGVFIQTLADPSLNSVVEIVFSGSGARPEVRVEAGVARKRVAPPRLQATVPSGIGVEILPPRDEYERWVARPACPTLGASGTTVPPDLPIASTFESRLATYRFCLMRGGQAGQKVLTIRCESEAGARARARARAGAGWKVVDVQRL